MRIISPQARGFSQVGLSIAPSSRLCHDFLGTLSTTAVFQILPFHSVLSARLSLGSFPSPGVTYCSPLSHVPGATNIVNTLVFKSIGFSISGLQPYSCSLSMSFVYEVSSPCLFVLSSVTPLSLSFSLIHQQCFILSFLLSGFLYYFALCTPATTQHPTFLSFH